MSDDDEPEDCQITIKTDTRGRLKERGNKGQTYDDVINELLDETEEEE